MYEMIGFNTVLTTAQRQQVEGYLARKWGIGALTGDPYRFGGPRIVPTQIPGCVFWIDAADTASMTLSGSNVTQWRDKSSNGHIGTAVASPILTTVDGFPAVAFNGSSQYIDFGTAGDLGSNQFHIFTVSKFNTTADGAIFARVANGPQYYRYTMIRSGGVNYLATQADTGGYGQSVAVTDTTTTRRLLNYSWDRSTIRGYQNGTEVGSVSYASTATYTSSFKLLVAAYNNSSGGTPPSDGFYMNGSINEILFYFGPLSTAQRQQVEGYLANKWGLQASFPAPAPVAIGPYAGPVIPMRAFSPLDVEGMMLWLDAADSNTLTLSGSNVTQWRDKSGNGNAATTATGTLTSSSNSVVFTGSQVMTTPLSSVMTTQTVFVVASAATNSYMDLLGVNGTSIDNGIQVIISNNYRQFVTRFGGSSIMTGGTVAQNTPFVYGLTYISGGNSFIYLNGSQTGSNATAAAISGTGTVMIGGYRINSITDEFYNGRINEVLIYNQVLSTSHRQQVENYLADKWGLRPSMSGVSHPFRFAPAMVLPTSIPGCRMWLDAADATTLTLSGSNVTQWNDKSGQGYTLTVPGGYISPTYSNGVLNMSGSNALWSTSNFEISGNTPVTLFLVGSTTSTSDNGPGAHIGYASTASPPQYFGLTTYQESTKTFLFTPSTFGGEIELVLSPNISGQRYLLTGFYDGTVINGTYNGTLRTSLPFTTANFSSRPFQIGLRNFNTGPTFGTVCESICYTGALSATQRQQVEGYLAWKWGIQSNLPSPTTSWLQLKRFLTPVFAPTHIPGCALWLDAADRTSLTLSGSSVTAWLDKSGNGRHAVGTSSNPTYNATGFNSRPTVTFSNNLLTSSNWSLAPNRQFAWFVVVHLTSLANIWQRILISASVGYTNGYLGTHDATSNILGIAGTTTISAPIATGTLSPQLVTYLFGTSELSSNTSAVSVNGGTFSTLGGNAGDIGTNGVIIGTDTGGGLGDRFLGHVSEVLCYNSDVTQAQRRRIEGYLAHKWGLLGTLGGVPHPYRFASITIVPTQFSGCALWLDATDSTSMTLSGSNVTQWRDKSSNAYAGTAVNSPVLQSNSINGLSAVQFNGSSQYITFGNVLNLGASHVHVFAVTRFTGDGTVIGKTSYRGFFGRWSIYRGAGDGGLGFSVDASPGAFSRFADTTTTTQLVRGSWDRSTLSITQNGTQRASNTLVNTADFSNTDNLLVAAYGNSDGTGVQPGFFLNGVIGEILVYLGTMTTVQRQQVEGYLAWKWGIQSNLPSSTHAYTTFKP
jgi:hypothetical protein